MADVMNGISKYSCEILEEDVEEGKGEGTLGFLGVVLDYVYNPFVFPFSLRSWVEVMSVLIIVDGTTGH